MRKRALVVVFGDLARSPRMQYHCVSLAEHHYNVTVIATQSDDKACDRLESDSQIDKLTMININFKGYLPAMLAYLVKTLWQIFVLLLSLLRYTFSGRPQLIIVQNPPSIPTLPIIYFYKVIVRSKLIIDWHNYGFTILSMNLGGNHPLVSLMKYLELKFGRLADAGFCVSKAMREDLRMNLLITYPVNVLYDRPPAHFKPLHLRAKHDFFREMQEQIPEFRSKNTEDHDIMPLEHPETRFTSQRPDNNIMPRWHRPAIILSSTSWTEDEDFDILLNALLEYERVLVQIDRGEKDQPSLALPDLVCVITGKGPLKAHYESKIRHMKFNRVQFVLPWLKSEDYPRMVASCDIGVCLHKSSSGVDLPMKVVDLFGCGIPTLAYRYEAINELVMEDHYGLTFVDSQDLFHKLVTLLESFHLTDKSDPELEKPLERYRKNIEREFLSLRWEANWDKMAKPLIDQLCTNSARPRESRLSNKDS